jgi:hypothetical protein
VTPGEVSALVAMVSAAWVNPPMSEATMRVYEQALLDLEDQPARDAVSSLLSTSKWRPSIAEIRAATVDIQAGPRRLGGEAWGDVCDAIHKVGVYPTLGMTPAEDRAGPPTFKDPLVGECVRIMGWRELCLGTNDAADRARFIALYDDLAERGRREQQLPPALRAAPPKGGFTLDGRKATGMLLSGIGNGGKSRGMP